jgi:2-methylisocitrate lyase-like PEP mutase family enzyme|tara:strand:- start:769 stop:1191 length:423 start_codon:yes stop_codon:yes gene_type:complete
MRAPARLRSLLSTPGIKLMPCCHDAMSAKLVEAAGFPLTFVSGFATSAAHGLPDAGLLSFGEMSAAMRTITSSLSTIPCMGDGDTGYGNAVNAKRTVSEYARAGDSHTAPILPTCHMPVFSQGITGKCLPQFDEQASRGL